MAGSGKAKSLLAMVAAAVAAALASAPADALPLSGWTHGARGDDNTSKGGLVQNVRCELPPGGMPSIKPIITDPADPPTQPIPDPNGPDDGAGIPPVDPVVDPGFRYHPPGKLVEQDAGRGRIDRSIWLRDIIFPLALGAEQQAYLNSQIWGYGGGGWGGNGAAGGSECDPRNFDPFQQRDNYCEVRGHSMPLCPAGKGHQGQDIRPPTCADNKWEAVAVVDGIIDLVTTNTTVRLKGNDGTHYRYLHMHPKSIRVRSGDRVKQGDVLGRVSRYMGGKIQTTRHLHFDVKQRVQIGDGPVRDLYVPVYASLIAAYRNAKGIGPGVDEEGNLIADHRLEIGVAPPEPEPVPEPVPVPPAQPQPAPDEPAPAEPTPPEPAPDEPAPAEPTQPEPAPDVPAPAEPTQPEPPPDEPAPAEPTQPEPAPDVPAPAEPTQPEPTPDEPAPVEPTQPQPAPDEPAPVGPTQPQPAPDVPAPAEPTQPEPTPGAPEPDEGSWSQWYEENIQPWWDWATSWWSR